jgi:hypothetical protein
MSDHLHPEANDHELLASALVDGAEQSSAAPLLVATVQAFAAVREALHAPLAVDASVREAAVSVAMAEYDRLVTARATGSSSPVGGGQVVDIASRRRWPMRVAAVAAAAALLGVVGVAAFGRTGDPEYSASDQSAAERIEIASGDAGTGGGAQEDGSGADEYASPTIGVINAPAEVVIAVNSPQQLLDLVAAKLAPLPDAPEADDAGGAGGEMMANGSAALQCLTEDQVFVAAIVYAGTPAIAVRDTVTGVTQALDEQCNVLAEAAP